MESRLGCIVVIHSPTRDDADLRFTGKFFAAPSSTAMALVATALLMIVRVVSKSLENLGGIIGSDL
jgi:hypothetical protein